MPRLAFTTWCGEPVAWWFGCRRCEICDQPLILNPNAGQRADCYRVPFSFDLFFFLVFRNCLQSQTTPFLLGRGWSSQPLGQLSGSFKWWVNNSTNVSTASLPFGLNIKPWCDLSRLSLLIGLLLEILFSNDSVGGGNGGGGAMVVVIAF